MNIKEKLSEVDKTDILLGSMAALGFILLVLAIDLGI